MRSDPVRYLLQQAESLSRLASELTTAVPPRPEGNDPTGYVTVVLGLDGLPAEVRVRDGWHRRIEPEQLGAAVLAANNDAVRGAVRALTDSLDDGGWWRHVREADEDEEDADPRTARLPEPPAGRAHHDLDFNEQVLKTLQNVRQHVDVGAQPSMEGSDDGRHVTVRLGAGGMTGCEIDPRWARDRDSGTVNAALARALTRARGDGGSKLWERVAETDALVNDALATLRSLTQSPPDRGDVR
ncbi:hypothetical protein [Actinoplanes sp. NPDC049802]|uniref:hypothetical protein n=1 Tax=Actinoplanes sp. NPDC049802 TaxID=3154742 RepID=UPI0033DED7AF